MTVAQARRQTPITTASTLWAPVPYTQPLPTIWVALLKLVCERRDVTVGVVPGDQIRFTAGPDLVRRGGLPAFIEFGKTPLGADSGEAVMESRERAEAILDPWTLRPSWVEYEVNKRLDGQITWFYRVQETFDWETPPG